MTFSGMRRRTAEGLPKICHGTANYDGVESLPEQAIGTVAPKRNARALSPRDAIYILGIPPPGNIPPMPRIILAMPPLVENFFIIFCICLCCLMRRPMSCT